jgi:uncharacterized protein YecT (DUF1311 family)
MNQIALMAIISIISLNAFANNGYCDGRGKQNAVQECYRVNVETVKQSLTKHYRALSTSPKYTVTQKQGFQKNQLEWEGRVNSQCKTWSCVYNSFQERDQALMIEINKK